jgi:hypothetical protein
MHAEIEQLKPARVQIVEQRAAFDQASSLEKTYQSQVLLKSKIVDEAPLKTLRTLITISGLNLFWLDVDGLRGILTNRAAKALAALKVDQKLLRRYFPSDSSVYVTVYAKTIRDN